MPAFPVTVQRMIASQKRTELVCGFYGYDHPRCKRAMKKDELLYIAFMNQISGVSDGVTVQKKKISAHTNNAGDSS